MASRRLITQLIAVTLGIVAIFAGFGITGVFVANVIAALIVLVMLRRLVGPIPGLIKAAAPRTGPYLAATPDHGRARTDRSTPDEFLFLQAYSTEAQLAMYSIGFMVISHSGGHPAVVDGGGSARHRRVIRRRHHRPNGQQTGFRLRIVSIALTAGTAGVVCLGPAMVIVLYGPDYTQAAELVPIMSLSLLFVTGGNLCHVLDRG